MAFQPKKIFIDQNVLHLPLTQRVLKNSPGTPFEVVAHRDEVGEFLSLSSDPIGEGKKYLWLTEKRGHFVKPCPCTPNYIGCNYYIINAVLNCPLNCTYCILQLYLTNPLITVYANLEDLWRELDRFWARHGHRFLRIGTGELGDSLALDPLTRTAREFIAYFRRKPHCLFELKTKTIAIEGILENDPAENIVLSWSLNAVEMAAQEEKEAPAVEQRLEAARAAVARGFPVGFHFDPLIDYPGWEEGYGAVIENLLQAIPASRIRWISLGCLRFPPLLAPIIAKRFPCSKVLCGELVLGRDGKLRYFKSIRLMMYQKMVRFLQSAGADKVPLYFCMEDEEIWREVLGLSPGRKEDVANLLLPRLEDQ